MDKQALEEISEVAAIAEGIGESEIVVYTESRFDDLFYAPAFDGAKNVSVRLTPPNGSDLRDQPLWIDFWQMEGKKTLRVSHKINFQDLHLVETIDANLNSYSLMELTRFSYRGIPVGMHSWETLLRFNQSSFDEPVNAKTLADLRSHLLMSCHLVDTLFSICKTLKPSFFFSGHDCYISATIKDVFADSGVPSWTLYKYMFNPVYTQSSKNYISSNNCIYSRRFIETQSISEESIWKPLAPRAKEKLDRLTINYEELNYMQGDFRHFDYTLVCGDSNLQYLDEHSCFLGEHDEKRIPDQSLVFVLALHSFADEACVHGLDSYAHMIEYFRSVSEAIVANFPDAYIAVRFHPNTLVKMEKAHEVYERDMKLQAKLLHVLQTISDRVIVSCCHARLKKLSDNFRVCVVTRWGSIGLECIHLNLPIVCSPLASYASLLPEEQVMDRRHTMETKIAQVGRKIIAGEPFPYNEDRLLSLCAAQFFTENGENRAEHFAQSKAGHAYMRARSTTFSNKPEARFYRLMKKLLSDDQYRRFTARQLKHFLLDSTESEKDRSIVSKYLNW